MTEEKKNCPNCNGLMTYIENDPEFGHLGWICDNDGCGRV